MLKWNNRGDKFCEGTSGKKLFIGYYNTETKWMVRNIKVHKSSVACCEIDPTSLFVISGSTDLCIYISSCYLPEVDDSHLQMQQKLWLKILALLFAHLFLNKVNYSKNYVKNNYYF
jgi:hypothetical protein